MAGRVHKEKHQVRKAWMFAGQHFTPLAQNRNSGL